MTLLVFVVVTAVALIFGLAAACVTVHHTEQITYKEVGRRLIHGYKRPDQEEANR